MNLKWWMKVLNFLKLRRYRLVKSDFELFFVDTCEHYLNKRLFYCDKTAKYYTQISVDMIPLSKEWLEKMAFSGATQRFEKQVVDIKTRKRRQG